MSKMTKGVRRPSGRPWTNVEVVLSSSISAPAVRMLHVVAWAGLENGKMKSGFNVYPVVAIESRITQEYSIDEEIPGYSSMFRADQLTGGGWRQSLPYQSFVPVIFDPDSGGIASPDQVEANNTVSRTILAPWQADEDAERIESVRQELMREAERLATNEAARKSRLA